MKNRARPLLVLLAGLAALVSGCYTPPEFDTVAIRVQHCYLNPDGRIAVTAIGGVALHAMHWVPDDAADNMPRTPVWFEADYVALGKTTPYGTVDGGIYAIAALPVSVLQQGAPDLAKLKQEGFVEVPFSEQWAPPDYIYHPPPFDPSGRPPVAHDTGAHSVWIKMNLRETKNFPEKIGISPVFYIDDGSAVRPMPITIEHYYLATHY